MKSLLFFPLAAVSLCYCATPTPADLENTIEVQDKKMYERIEKARVRQETRERRWEDYSRRQDEKYDAWLDGLMN